MPLIETLQLATIRKISEEIRLCDRRRAQLAASRKAIYAEFLRDKVPTSEDGTDKPEPSYGLNDDALEFEGLTKEQLEARLGRAL